MKKDKKIWFGLAILGIILLSKKPGAPTPAGSTIVEPAVEPVKPADVPNSVSGRYYIRNKTA
ncbi:MAG: hypothetical protein HUU01_00530 [Saprospiraceae bacterium]|nr:hypothetical protein [Saprospiraceae bacterium]